MHNLVKYNQSWTFHLGFRDELVAGFVAGENVTLPHNAVDLPYNYFDEADYQKPFTYQKIIVWDPAFEGKEVSLIFDGVMADSVVYLNGTQIGAHADGYTPFEIRLTGKLNQGENLLTVKIDGSENPDIPPFGDRIDYLTYAGIYRDVWLKVVDPISIANIKIETANELTDAKSVSVRCDLYNPQDLAVAGIVKVQLSDVDGNFISETEGKITSNSAVVSFSGLADLSLWDVE
ncbi:MAG: glycoside hydrolase family 2 protein, partial [OCS116 cluster bacterium]|nr:glycoside hydrolase family 2 protein [OCS116 cluster bacterium]